MNKSLNRANLWLGKSSPWGFAPASIALLLALVTSTAFAQAGSVLSPETQKAVAEFKAANPKWKDEFYPFEQDCIDGKTSDKQCEANVKDDLVRLKAEVSLAAEKAQVNAEKAQVNAKEAQVNAEGEMINRLTIVTVVMQLNNSIQFGNPDRSGIAALARIKRPALQSDIAFMRNLDIKLNQKQMIDRQEIRKLQEILIARAQEALEIYEKFSPEIQAEFESSKMIARGALKYTIKTE